jgi:hypothetical protein
MEKETIKNIIDFLEKKENKKHKDRDTFIWKVKLGYPLTKEDLIVKGDLNLYNSNIETLPDGLYIEGYLDLKHSKIKSLPEGLKVDYQLNLQFTEIKSLPKGLDVGWTLDLYNTNIKSLPKGLKVGGDLIIKSTFLTNYDDDRLRKMVKPGFIKGEIIRS